MGNKKYTNKAMEKIATSEDSSVGFLQALFDFRFEHFIFIRVATFFYSAMVVFVILAGATFVVAVMFGAFGSLNTGLVFAVALGTPVVVLLYIILLRITFESGIALVKIAENTKKN
jgi:hypothetical protein